MKSILNPVINYISAIKYNKEWHTIRKKEFSNPVKCISDKTERAVHYMTPIYFKNVGINMVTINVPPIKYPTNIFRSFSKPFMAFCKSSLVATPCIAPSKEELKTSIAALASSGLKPPARYWLYVLNVSIVYMISPLVNLVSLFNNFTTLFLDTQLCRFTFQGAK